MKKEREGNEAGVKVHWCTASATSLYQRREAEGLRAFISVRPAKLTLGIILVGTFLLPAKAGPGPEHARLARCALRPSNVLLEPQKRFWRSHWGGSWRMGVPGSVFSPPASSHLRDARQSDNPWGSGAGSGTWRGQHKVHGAEPHG